MDYEMTAALAHEIKNPAAVALAHVNLLRLESADFTHHLNHIEKALNNICDLVRDMLFCAYSRSEVYEVDLRKIISEILETYRAAWPDITFSFENESALSCLGHETSLRMIFSNLIKNAVEAIEAAEPEAGEIKIAAAYHEDFLDITISDNGDFDKTHEKPHGNGLGLAICRSLANGIGALLSVSPAENGGCDILVRLRRFLRSEKVSHVVPLSHSM